MLVQDGSKHFTNSAFSGFPRYHSRKHSALHVHVRINNSVLTNVVQRWWSATFRHSRAAFDFHVHNAGPWGVIHLRCNINGGFFFFENEMRNGRYQHVYFKPVSFEHAVFERYLPVCVQSQYTLSSRSSVGFSEIWWLWINCECVL